MVWLTNQQISRWRRKRVLVGSFLCWLFVMFITPKVPLSSPSHHVFADKRNFLGFFTISLKGEIWGWVLFYAGVAGLAFGSAYYHLKSDDNRIIWDTLPILIAYSSLFSSFLVERAGERAGLCCLVSLLFIAFLSIAYAGVFNDLRLCMTFQLIPFVAIPVLTILLPPKYTHSKYWLWASGAYILSGIENLADSKIYNANRYLISGHSLGHLCSAAAPILLTIMLLYRSIRFHRLGDLKGHP
ncbi:PREDICTED: uncharacterized protein LOC104799163 isoform X2 [Tarenaya hassleriana]|uniref:uncharacterized protein LOC104799163 isoform X2 n=1 Tax=Tarenaya hassleriana TaxID=28532 RepID=UPI00053C444F|nr:PREDICTED: uncharacterized protein LOC104799163 isoform X2 [Tarenaya hassleriana]